MSVGKSVRVVILLYSFLMERMASACNGTLGEGLGHVTAAVGRDAPTKEILQGYSVKTKCFVEKTKCLVVFSKCFVIFSKYYLVFSSCLGAENRAGSACLRMYVKVLRIRIYAFYSSLFFCKLYTNNIRCLFVSELRVYSW